MDISITGRHLTVSDAVREQVSERLNANIAKLSDRVIRVEVEFTAAEFKGDPEGEIRCEITLRAKGPVVRASAHSSDKLLAYGLAEEKLITQLRKAADRRKKRRGLRADREFAELDLEALNIKASKETKAPVTRKIHDLEITGDGPLVVREKHFTGTPLTLAQALDEMELVGHDFFLYVDAETRLPSVAYRRKAYDYGVIHLEIAD